MGKTIPLRFDASISLFLCELIPVLVDSKYEITSLGIVWIHNLILLLLFMTCIVWGTYPAKSLTLIVDSCSWCIRVWLYRVYFQVIPAFDHIWAHLWQITFWVWPKSIGNLEDMHLLSYLVITLLLICVLSFILLKDRFSLEHSYVRFGSWHPITNDLHKTEVAISFQLVVWILDLFYLAIRGAWRMWYHTLLLDLIVMVWYLLLYCLIHFAIVLAPLLRGIFTRLQLVNELWYIKIEIAPLEWQHRRVRTVRQVVMRRVFVIFVDWLVSHR